MRDRAPSSKSTFTDAVRPFNNDQSVCERPYSRYAQSAVAQMTRFGPPCSCIGNHKAPLRPCSPAFSSRTLAGIGATTRHRRRIEPDRLPAHRESATTIRRLRFEPTAHSGAGLAFSQMNATALIDCHAVFLYPAGAPERWPSGRRRSPAKGVGLKRASWVRIPSSPPAPLFRENLSLRSLRVETHAPVAGPREHSDRAHVCWVIAC